MSETRTPARGTPSPGGSPWGAAGNAPVVTRRGPQLLIGAERAWFLAEFHLKTPNGFLTAESAEALLPSMEAWLAQRILTEPGLVDHVEACPQCAELLSLVETAEGFSAVWNLHQKAASAKPPVVMTWDEVTSPILQGLQSIAEAVKEAGTPRKAGKRTTKITKGKDGSVTAETSAT